MRKIKFIAVPVLIAALLLGGCDVQNPEPVDTKSSQETAQTALMPPDASVSSLFGVAYSTQHGNFNPILEHPRIDEALYSLLYDSLFKDDGAYGTVPVLCESIEISGTEITITVKENVFFHDGGVLRAQDVVYSLNMARNNEKSLYRQRLSPIENISVQSNNAVLINLSTAKGGIERLLDVPIIRVGTGISSDAIGCGRYMTIKDEEMLYLVPYSSWHGGIPKNPTLSHILMTPVQDKDVLIYGVVSGNIDIITVDKLPENELFLYSDADIYPVDTRIFYYFAFNVRRVPSALLRQAISLTTDSGALCETAFMGHITPSFGIYPKDMFSTTERENKTNHTKAHELMVRAGYTLSGGRYWNAVGEELELSVLTKDSAHNIAAANAFAESLREFGIVTQTEIKSKAEYDKAVREGKFDIYLGNAEVGPDYDFSFLLSGRGIGNYSNFSDAGLGGLLTGFAEAGIGQGQLLARQIEEQIKEHAPIIPIGYKVEYVYVGRKYRLKDIKVTAGDVFYNVFEWQSGIKHP